MSQMTSATSIGCTLTLDEIMRRPWQALTSQELDALDAQDIKETSK